MSDPVAEMVAAAERAAMDAPPPPRRGTRPVLADENGEPFAGFDGNVDPDTVEQCAGLDHSDTDNARRLVWHFGEDLTVMHQEGADRPPYGAWAGTHWDFSSGPQRAFRIAQRLGGAIALETAFLNYTDRERAAIEAAADIVDVPLRKRSEEEIAIGAAADDARKALKKRKERKMAHAVSSKNIARLRAVLDCAAPNIMALADSFNPDAFRFACLTHTVRFEKTVRRVKNPAWADPDNSGEDVPEFIEKVSVKVVAEPGHDRADRITACVPVRYDPKAVAVKWQVFLDRYLPDKDVRDMVQAAAGQGLLGVGLQLLFFHYGRGANGKSAFMEALGRVLGDLSVTLPAESITGQAKGNSGPSPDLARLYGKRLLRVAELPKGQPLQVELIKKLTGGERMPVRDLYKGYFDFTPMFVAHMSGNDYPKTDGTDYGTWRRLVVVKWPVTIPESERRNFEEVMAEFREEYPGILNWLIAGAKRFIEDGRIVLAEESIRETSKYREDMDPLAGFIAGCVDHAPGEKVQAKLMFEAYELWASANGVTPLTGTTFGKSIKGYFDRDNARIRHYLDCRLHDVPPAPHVGSYGDHDER